ncbi:MAG: protoporphyrinogen/coproporphyrinogen oxidase [Gemmatimonadaceae bacterium]
MSAERILIVGAGPTGVAAAWRLGEHGRDNWRLVEARDQPGGLASSVCDAAGFTWDLGGHVLFSHYRYFDRLMSAALGDAWVEHEREAWVWMRERWIPYPLQNNIWRLPPIELIACLEGLVAIQKNGAAPPSPSPSPSTIGSRNPPLAPPLPPGPATFADWLQRSFGEGLCNTFMTPYNTKVWAYPPQLLGVGWMGERVATVDLARVLRNLVLQRDEVSWGPNATFRFPLHGGTGAIWRSLAGQLPGERLTYDAGVTRIDTVAKRVHLADGSTDTYDHLISSMPLDVLLRTISDQPALSALADRFVFSASHIVGVGFEGETPDMLRTKCWMYFPEDTTPFYRATVFSNYSPNNVARPGEQWSLMAEVSESPLKPVDASRVVDDVMQGFRRTGFIDDRTVIATRWHRRLPRGYPTPWLERDQVLAAVQPRLEELGILSRGRFGAWRYEVSNQDHSAMQGVEAVDRILLGTPETTVLGRMDAEPPVIERSRRPAVSDQGV